MAGAALGLAPAPALRANDIDLEILPDLSDEDLKELGLSLGHRRRLLRAIGELANERSQPAPHRSSRDFDAAAPSGGAGAFGGAAPAHCAVLRSRRLDRTVAAGTIPRICASSWAAITMR